MYSIKFPNMLSNQQANLVKDHQATSQNIKYLLLSDKMSMIGDPYFGTRLKYYFFEQNNYIIKDLVIDEIYTAILQFMPQIVVKRQDITVTSDGVDIFVNIKALNIFC